MVSPVRTAGGGVDRDDRHADVDGVTLGGQQLGHHTRERAGQLDERLGGLDLDDHLVDRDGVADRDPPLDDLGLGEALAGVGEKELLVPGHR